MKIETQERGAAADIVTVKKAEDVPKNYKVTWTRMWSAFSYQ